MRTHEHPHTPIDTIRPHNGTSEGTPQLAGAPRPPQQRLPNLARLRHSLAQPARIIAAQAPRTREISKEKGDDGSLKKKKKNLPLSASAQTRPAPSSSVARRRNEGPRLARRYRLAMTMPVYSDILIDGPLSCAGCPVFGPPPPLSPTVLGWRFPRRVFSLTPASRGHILHRGRGTMVAREGNSDGRGE